ncbi:ABC transporter ATP-binding protein [Halobellus clavatus]|jgi:ABC-2 type transport system ATP-binding protein|uniref:ABC-2 type transport system ATP-binding protein n=1 Tax=Halobellus clavatus TaxID=660517 RepID=A0A1H3E532_9EURY|nr:ABC transporter ATP-binding protein [Halobellus clavatus]SDX73034.1 ABC-2 type transport system ATP-binding protein [Halobellus clavatus]
MTMIETRGLTKEYGDVTAVTEVDLTVDRGDIHGFVGHNGAGKTTTMQMLTGLVTPTRGEAYIGGEPAGTRAATKKIGYAPQDPAFYESMTGRDYLTYMGELSAVDGSTRERADELLTRLNLTDAADQAVEGYSGGMLRRLAVGQAMLGDPELLILDEPTAALDPEGRAMIIDALESLTDEGTTIFVSSHVLTELEQFIDTVTFLKEGQVVTSGPLTEVLSDTGIERFVVDASDNDRAARLLATHESVDEVDRNDDGAVVVRTDDPEGFAVALPQALSDATLGLYSVDREGGLEERFLDILDDGGED